MPELGRLGQREISVGRQPNRTHVRFAIGDTVVVMDEPAEWIDDHELARRTPIARASWQTWRCRGMGPPYYKAGRRCLYKWREVLQWLEANRVDPKR